ncbi:MAG: efflux transporter outer membrane subunit [Rudaea sp.]
MPRLTKILMATALSAALGACHVPPRPTQPELRNSSPLDGIPTGANATWPDQAWWTRYHDEDLNAIESMALAKSPDLAVARARFSQATKTVDIARSAGAPSIDGNVQVQRERLSENGLIPPAFLGFTWYTQGDIGAQFKYDFDFWGSHRADIAANVDRARAAAAERVTAANMLTAAIADSYFGWQLDMAHIGLTVESIGWQEKIRKIAEARVQHGLDPYDILHQADAGLAAMREDAATYKWNAQMRREAIAALIGVPLAEVPEFHAHELPAFTGALPASAGLDLIARRADIEASRWRVEAAMREIDIARAAFYPDISISAMIGLSAIDLDKVFRAGSRVVDAGPAIHLPIFEGGRLRARYGASQAALDAAVADYDKAVVDAAHDVAQQALALAQIQARRKERAGQIEAAERLYQSSLARGKRGLTDARAEYNADLELIRQHDADTQLVAAGLSAEIALTKALGGGYLGDPNNNNTASAGASQP